MSKQALANPEYLELYRIALTYTRDIPKAQALVEAWFNGRAQSEQMEEQSHA